MKKYFFVTLLISISLIGCNQQTTKELKSEAVLLQSEKATNEDDTPEQIVEENDEVVSETSKSDDIPNEEITEEVPESSTEEVDAKPVFKSLPEDASYEAMVLVHSGVEVHEQPDANSEPIDNLIFGAHMYAISDENNMTYVYSNGVEGWVNQSEISQIPYDSSEKNVVDNPDDILVLVNKQHKLPIDYKPTDLVTPNVAFPFEEQLEKKYMREIAAKALEEMFVSSQEAGLELFATSGYRSFSTQQRIFPNNVNRVGFTEANQYSAFPGESEHQTGLAMDVTNREVQFQLIESFGKTKEGIWVQENAHKFGFIIRYPKGKEDITGYAYEPWHLRYVGKEIAAEIFEFGLTFEEFIGDGSRSH